MSDKIVIRSAMKDKRNFTELPELRKGIIDLAPTTPLTANYAVNSVANALHPTKQSLKVSQCEEIAKNVMIYSLVPDPTEGTAKLAYFRAGQLIDLYYGEGDQEHSEAFTICSSPARSLNNEYVIIVNKSSDSEAADYITSNWQAGTQIKASAPYGQFYYQAIRDNSYIVAICDSTAYEPFLSMAESINDGALNVDLTLIFAARKHSDVVMADRFLELSQNKHFKFIMVLSDERVFKCERGFITKSLIEKYAPTSKYSLFISGSQELLNTISPHVDELKFETNRIRYNK
ncbi:MAG: hypothetical protein IKV44_04340 [Clostridia bacterium]|nr:hypothetical protein [Clostridia bacterium]